MPCAPSVRRRSRPHAQAVRRENSASKAAGGEVLVYLDIDGVLNTTEGRKAREHLSDELIACLRQVIESVPTAAIVLSSSWRLQPALMEALQARFTAEGVPPPVGVTGQVPLVDRDPSTRGECNARGIEAELARLAAQRGAEINAHVLARQPQAWIAIDDLDLRPPAQSTLRMGYPPRQPESEDGRLKSGSGGLPPLAARRPFTMDEKRAMLPQHPLATRLPRRNASRGPEARPEKWIDSQHFVHTSEATGLTSERSEFAVALLRAQLRNDKELPRLSAKERSCSH